MALRATEKNRFYGKAKMACTLPHEHFHDSFVELFYERSEGDDDLLVVQDHVHAAYEQFKSYNTGECVVIASDGQARTKPRPDSLSELKKLFNLLYYYSRDPSQYRYGRCPASGQ